MMTGIRRDEGPCRYRFSLCERIAGLKYLLGRHCQKPRWREEPFGESLTRIRIDDFSIYVPRDAFKAAELSLIYHEVMEEGAHNPHAYMTGAVHVRPGDHVVDAGACEGFFSLLALRRGAARVYAFEPLKELSEGLRQTFSGSGERVEVVGKGLSDKAGVETVAPEEGEGTISSSHFDEHGDVTVETMRLDDFVERHPCPRIDFIKADVEGAEVRCIAGSVATLRRFKPRLSIAVYHDYGNARSIKETIMDAVPEYKVEFGGCYMAEKPWRPFMLYAWT